MFTWDSQDIIRFYGNKLLFLPDNRAEKGVETTTPAISAASEEVILNEKETQKVEIVSHKEAIIPDSPPVIETKVVAPPIIEKVETPSTPIVNAKPYTFGESVQWKMRPNVACKLIVIVSANEFKNTVLMGALLFMIEEKGKIPRTSVSFGVYQPEQHTWNLSDMPAKTAILFADKATENAILGDKKIYAFPSMSKIALDIPLQEKCINLFKSLS